jgi:hypothetical protein
VILGYLLPQHFKDSLGGLFVGEKVMEMTKSIAQAAGNGDGASQYVNVHAKKMGVFNLPIGPRNATVHIEITKTKLKVEPLWAFQLRLEFNPRKIQPSGIEELKWTFEMVTPPFDFGRFLADARVTRFDVAVDFVGITPGEVIATAKNPGKRLDIAGNDGVLESFQLFRKRKASKKPLKFISKPLGPSALKVYDRNRERAAHGKPPPVEGKQCLRAEVVRTLYTSTFGLVQMHQEIPFSNIALSYGQTCAPWLPPSRWRAYLACRRALGHTAAVAALGLNFEEAKRAEAAHAGHPNTLCQGLSLDDWQKGIQETGLDHLVELAADAVVTSTAAMASGATLPK